MPQGSYIMEPPPREERAPMKIQSLELNDTIRSLKNQLSQSWDIGEGEIEVEVLDESSDGLSWRMKSTIRYLDGRRIEMEHEVMSSFGRAILKAQKTVIAQWRQLHSDFQHYYPQNCPACHGFLDRESLSCIHQILLAGKARSKSIARIVAKEGLQPVHAFLLMAAYHEGGGAHKANRKTQHHSSLGTIHITIEWRENVYTLKCDESDIQGHRSESSASNRPHWHMQIQYKGRTVMQFGQHHFPLSDGDIGVLRDFPLEYQKRTGLSAHHQTPFVLTAQDLQILIDSDSELFSKSLIPGLPDEDGNAHIPFRVRTAIRFDGDLHDIPRLIERAKSEAKAKGILERDALQKILKKEYPQGGGPEIVDTTITPQGVPSIRERRSRRKKRKRDT